MSTAVKPTSAAQRSIASLSSTQSSPSRNTRRPAGATTAEAFVKNRSQQAPASTTTFPTSYGSTAPSGTAGATTAASKGQQQATISSSRTKFTGNYDSVRVPVPDTLGMSMANGMWGQSIGADYGRSGGSQFKSEEYDDGTDESLNRWQNGGDTQSQASYFQEDTFPALSDTTNDFKDRGNQNYIDYDDHYSDENTAAYPSPNSPKRPRLAESALPKSEDDYYSDEYDNNREDIEIDKKVEDTKRRLSLERQQLYPKAAPASAIPTSTAAATKAPQRTTSTRSKAGTAAPVAIRTRSPEARKSLSFGGSPEPANGRGQSGHSLSRKRDYSMLKDVNFQSLTQQKWHQSSASTRTQPQAKTPSASAVYSPPAPSVSADEHAKQQVAYFSSLPSEEYYNQRELLLKQMQSLLEESKTIREDFIKGVMDMEKKINDRSTVVETRRNQINQYMDGVKEKLRGVTSGNL